VGCCISTGRIVWAPVPGLMGPDADQDSYYFFKIFEEMGEDEFILGDGHYAGVFKSKLKNLSELTKDVQHVRAIIEHVNGRIKNWNIMFAPFRGAIEKHHVVFKLCTHITNLQFFYEPVHKTPHHLLYTTQ